MAANLPVSAGRGVHFQFRARCLQESFADGWMMTREERRTAGCRMKIRAHALSTGDQLASRLIRSTLTCVLQMSSCASQ